jgi:tetraacyldisaccharide 4'-kinase
MRRLAAALQRAWWAPRPTALALALHPLSMLYSLLAWLHRALSWPRGVGLPLIVVGNLIVGGAGKTPTVIALVRLLRAFGWTPGVISRGHGRTGGGVREASATSHPREVGDEPLLIHLRARVPVVVSADRLAAAAELRRAHPEVDIVIADDGLQHHRLARDAEVLVFDDRGVGNGLRLPAGPLRESLPLDLAHQRLVLYNALEPSTPLPGWMARRHLAGALPLDAWARGEAATAEGWTELRAQPRVIAAAGIAAPERFFAALRDEGLTIEPLPLPDHFNFERLPWPADAAAVVVTEKDAVKLRGRELGPTRVWVAPLDFEPDLGFAAAVKRLFPKPPSR